MNSTKHNAKLSIATLLLAFLLVGGVGSLAMITTQASSNSPSLYNVQVFVQTKSNNMSYYSLTAYNSSGYEVASSSSTYPGFGLEIPSGTYLITVTATQLGYYYPIEYTSGLSSSAVASPSTNASSTPISYPPIKVPMTEYGYALQTVSGATTLNIKTTPFDNIGTAKVHVSVSYANGTAASGEYVSASVVGGYYYYGLNTKSVLSNMTGTDGSTTLVVPNLPVLLSAWTSFPVIIPENVTTFASTTATPTVNGNLINSTVYWPVNYVEFTGSALIIPPQTSAHITLHVDQHNYTLSYASGTAQPGSAVSSSATASNGFFLQSYSNSSIPTQIPAFGTQAASSTTISTTPSSSLMSPLSEALIIVTLVLLGIAGTIAFRFKKK